MGAQPDPGRRRARLADAAPVSRVRGRPAGGGGGEVARLTAQLRRLKAQVVATAAAAEEEQERLAQARAPRSAVERVSAPLIVSRVFPASMLQGGGREVRGRGCSLPLRRPGCSRGFCGSGERCLLDGQHRQGRPAGAEPSSRTPWARRSTRRACASWKRRRRGCGGSSRSSAASRRARRPARWERAPCMQCGDALVRCQLAGLGELTTLGRCSSAPLDTLRRMLPAL